MKHMAYFQNNVVFLKRQVLLNLRIFFLKRSFPKFMLHCKVNPTRFVKSYFLCKLEKTSFSCVRALFEKAASLRNFSSFI